MSVSGVTIQARIVASVGAFPAIGTANALIVDQATVQAILAAQSAVPLRVTSLEVTGIVTPADPGSAFWGLDLSTEQVARGKPAPDIYLAVAGLLGRPLAYCAAVEDSSNGLRSAAAAGLRVIAVPHPRYPPAPDALGAARLVLSGLDELTPDAVTALAA